MVSFDIDGRRYDIYLNVIQNCNSITYITEDTFLWRNYAENYRFGVDAVCKEEVIG